jgi:dolichyl-phosphate beta-glucosyltransferase
LRVLNPANVSISLIIPAYNEENVIGASLQRLQSYCMDRKWDFEIIVVVDGCSDNTAGIVDSYHLQDNRISVLRVPTRLGKGGSIAVAALQSNTKDYVAYLDADLAADPSHLDQMILYMDDHDIVIGSRILRGNLPRVKRPFYRTLFSLLYSKIFRTLFRMQIYDPQCGLKVFKSTVLPALLKNTTVSGFAFDTDLIVTAFSLSLRIKEIPVKWAHGASSTVSILSEIRSMGLDILSIWYNYHLKWQKHEICYPQKKGSIPGRCLFGVLAQIQSVKTRPQKYSKYRNILAESTSPKVSRNTAAHAETTI